MATARKCIRSSSKGIDDQAAEPTDQVPRKSSKGSKKVEGGGDGGTGDVSAFRGLLNSPSCFVRRKRRVGEQRRRNASNDAKKE